MKGTFADSLVDHAAGNDLQPPIQVQTILPLIARPHTNRNDLHWFCQRQMDGAAVLPKTVSRYETPQYAKYRSPLTVTDRTLLALLIRLW